MELNEQNIQNALIFLARVELKGTEAQALYELQMILSFMANKLSKPPEVPIEEPIAELTEKPEKPTKPAKQEKSEA